MFAPGYYKTNYRALRFRELVRMRGWQRSFKAYWVTRFMPSTAGHWMPSLWEDLECQPEALSANFWQATKPYRQTFEALGFVECGCFKATKVLNPVLQESGGLHYLDAAGQYFGQLHCHQLRRVSQGIPVNRITISFMAVYAQDLLACTNHTKGYDPPEEHEVIRIDSHDVAAIHRRFLEAVQGRREAARQFADVEALRRWFDARQLRRFEAFVRRGLFVRMTDQEVSQARLASQRPPPLKAPLRFGLRQGLWVALVAALILLQMLRWGHLGKPGHSGSRRLGSDDTVEYRGQQFKTRKAYATYEDYKDDPDNLDTNELDRIEQTMVTARVPNSIQNRKQFTHFLFFEMEFPGYGLSFSPRVETDDGSKLEMDSVEIPQREKERCFVVRDSGGKFQVLDDFVYSTATNMIERVKLEQRKLRYYDRAGHLIREKEL